MRNASALSLLFLVIGWASGAEVPRAEQRPPSFEQLLEQLGDRDGRVRENASQALELLGPAVLPRLKAVSDPKDPEVRRRLAALILVLEKAPLLQPRLITLQNKQWPMREAVAELAKQSGFKVELYPSGADDERTKQLHTLAFDQQPFWQALDRLCQVGGLALQRTYGDDNRLQLRFDETYVPHVAHAGAFRLVAQGFQYHRTIEFSALPRNASQTGQRGESLTFRFTVMAEPRMPMLWVGPAVLTEAVDERGNSLLPPAGAANEAERQGFHDRSYYHDAWTNLVRPRREAETVKLLRGVVPIRVLVEQTPELVLDNPRQAKAQKLKSDNTELDIEEFKEDGAGRQRYELKFAVRSLRSDPGNDYHFYNSIRHRFELQDAKGNKYNWSGGGWGGNENSVRGTFSFSQPGGEVGPPAKLIFYGWTTLYHRVPFEFRDLPLP
jgi:hypothetical protein